MSTYLPDGFVAPKPTALDAPYWEGLRAGKLLLQRSATCRSWQWGPEWICHACHGFELGYEEVEPAAAVFSWERVWHPVHPALAEACPYVVVVAELPQADGVRLVGNLLGDPGQEVPIGAPLDAVFEHHDGYSLLQWRRRA